MSKKSEKIPLGCMGNKKYELKSLLPIIESNIDDKTIFIEPFCGSCIVSYSVFKKHNNIEFHVNDIDEKRIKFYTDMRSEEEINKLYELEKKIEKEGEDTYYDIIKGNDEYITYIISRRISAFRYGLFPTTKKLIISKIPDKWNSFFKQSKITCLDYKEILEKYKYNENAFIYLDPPYLDSYNSGYGKYHGKSYDENLNIIDNTIMYIDFLELLKYKCKVLFSINANALTRYLYKDYIKEEYNKNYSTTHINTNTNGTRKKTNILIISNF